MWSEEVTKVSEMRAAVDAFVGEREWQRYHTPVNTASAAAVEAAELVELFQWRRDEDPVPDTVRRAAAEELADVMHYALALANAAECELVVDGLTLGQTFAVVGEKGLSLKDVVHLWTPKEAAESVLEDSTVAIVSIRTRMDEEGATGAKGTEGAKGASDEGDLPELTWWVEHLVGSILLCARTMGIDLARELELKMGRNRERFPVGSRPDVGY